MPETETPVPPAKPGAVDPHSGRRSGGVESIEGGNQDAPKAGPKSKSPPEK